MYIMSEGLIDQLDILFIFGYKKYTSQRMTVMQSAVKVVLGL